MGTGKVGHLFADRGWEVLGVEPDERMAALARRHGLTVDAVTFEAWDPAGRGFDMVISAEAWHWVDPRIGPAKAADVLEPGGSLAVFWNRLATEPATRLRLDEVYQQVAPEIAMSSAEPGALGDNKRSEKVHAVEASGRFTSVEVRSYPWATTYSADQYLDKLQTHSDHLLLPPNQLHELLRRVGKVIAENGGHLTVTYTTTLIVANAPASGD